jgi:phage gp36-like protein
MAYATAADMEARFPVTELIELTNQNDPAVDTINAASMSVALDDASAAIDTVLGSRMRTPVSPAPSVLISVCCDIARYRLYSARSTEEVEKRYDNAIKLLKSIAAGDIDIGSQSGSKAVFTKPEPVFVGKDML